MIKIIYKLHTGRYAGKPLLAFLEYLFFEAGYPDISSIIKTFML
jgi:hypothetical protein